MKILHINSYFSSGIFYKNLYDAQVKQGLDISVYVPVAKGITLGHAQFGGYTTVSKNHGKYDRFIFHLKHSKILNDIKKKFKIKEYDIMHAHSLFSNGYIAYKLHNEFGVPYVVAMRNTDINTFFKYMIHLRKLGINIMLHAHQIVFLSSVPRGLVLARYVPQNITEQIKAKSIVIPNGINDFWSSNKLAEKRKKPATDVINIIFAGRITANKNVSTTIKACEVLLKRGFKVKFTVVGNIDNNQEYQKLKKHDFVTYIQHCPKEKLIQLYRKNDIFVMPSKTETFGLVYAEAMSQGLPVIYTRGQGFDGQFPEGEVGYSVPYDSPAKIAKRVRDIINRYDTISNNCINKVGKFNWDKIAKSYLRVYRGCMDKQEGEQQ